jgi:small subunit ribosomal protein S3Ae
MAKRTVTKQSGKVKKKRWCQIQTTNQFNNTVLGESYVSEPGNLLNKHVNVNLMTLTNEVRKQHISLKFKVKKVVESKGTAEPVSYSMSGSFIKKLVRRKRNKIDISFTAYTKDGFPIVMKILLITISCVPNSVATALHKKAIAYSKSFLKQTPFQEAINKMISYSFQKTLKDNLKKIYPLKTTETRFFGIATESRMKSSKMKTKETEDAKTDDRPE